LNLRSDLSWLLVLLISLAVFLPGLGAYPLLDPDEGRNAQVALEVVRDGHWLPPTLNGQVRYQKPPLYYWMVASSFLALGPGETSARLPSALAALLGVLVVLFMGEALWGREKGLLAATIIATTFIYALYSHIVIFDMVLTFFIVASLLFAWKGIEEEKKGAWSLASFFMAMAFLTKGPVGMAIPLMTFLPVLLYKSLVDKERISIPWPLAILVFLLIAAPTFVLAELREPGYCYHFFWEENVLRYLTPRFHRGAPFYYYLPVILLGLLPWTFLLPNAMRKLQELWRLYPHRTIFLTSWIILPTLFFSLAKAKMPHYILPTFPAWALLIAGTWKENQIFPFKLIPPVLIAYLLVFMVAMPIYSKRKSAAFAVPLMVKNDSTPLYTYKAEKRYSLAFYSGKKIRNFKSVEELKNALDSVSKAYVLTKREKLGSILALSPPYSLKVLGTSPKLVLVEIENPFLHSSTPPKNPTTAGELRGQGNFWVRCCIDCQPLNPPWLTIFISTFIDRMGNEQKLPGRRNPSHLFRFSPFF